MFEIKKGKLKPHVLGPNGSDDTNEYLMVLGASNACVIYGDALTWHLSIEDVNITGDWQDAKEVEKIIEKPVETVKHMTPKDYFGQELSSISFK